MTVDEMLAREEIRDLFAAYNHAGDRGDRSGFASVFTDDAVLDFLGERYVGPEAIVTGLWAEASPLAERPYTFIRHHLGTGRIRLLDASTAEARTYFSVVTDIGLDHAGVYVDRLRRTGEGWRIARREIRIEFVAENHLVIRDLRRRVESLRAAGSRPRP